MLRHIGMHHEEGLRLTDLIGLSGFDKSTVHRLLTCLTDEGFIERVANSKIYRLGVESVQLGLVSTDMAPLVDRFRPTMLRIARMSGESVFLVTRSGNDALCLHRVNGAYPVKTILMEAGKRRMLGVSAAGVGILAYESDDNVTKIYTRNALVYESVGMTLSMVFRLINATRQTGFAEMTAFGPLETAGVGYVLPISATTRVGVSIAGNNSRMHAQRRHELGILLRQELATMVWTDPKGPINNL